MKLNTLLRIIPLLLLCTGSVCFFTYLIFRMFPDPQEKVYPGLQNSSVNITVQGYPAGTVYADLLIRDGNLKHYKEMYDRNQSADTDPYLSLGKSSGIYNYNTDGYVSAAFFGCEQDHLELYRRTPETEGILTFSLGPFYGRNGHTFFQKHYKDFKIAYVDQKGSVLGVTGEAKRRISLDRQTPMTFRANGSNADYSVYSEPAFLAVTALKVIAVHLLVLLLIRILRRSQQKEGAGS